MPNSPSSPEVEHVLYRSVTTRILSINTLLFLLPALLISSCDRVPDRPNIVVILADDMGYGDTGAYNSESKISTPHIDRVARDGMRFTDAHSPSAVCTPTRYGLLTGRYAWRTHMKRGVLVGYSKSLIDTTRLTLPQLLQQNGYATGAIGKWHLGLGSIEPVDYYQRLAPGPNALGFDYFYGIPSSLDFPPYVYVHNEWVVQAPTDTIGRSEHRRRGGGGFWRAGAIAPDFDHADVLPVTTLKAVEFIDGHADSAPFFLFVPLSAPHTPWLPDSSYMGTTGAGMYGDFVAQVDDVVGDIFDALDRNGIADKTLLIVTSDNGAHWPPGDVEHYGHRANRELRGQKADIWEGGHRVPFIARWPERVEAGAVSDQLVSLTDLMATAASIVQVELPPDAAEDSYDILGLLQGTSSGLRTSMVQHSLNGFFALRDGDWKLIPHRGSGGFSEPRDYIPEPGEPAGQLYNLSVDLSESVNLYDEHPEKVAELEELLEQIQTQGHSRPLPKR